MGRIEVIAYAVLDMSNPECNRTSQVLGLFLTVAEAQFKLRDEQRIDQMNGKTFRARRLEVHEVRAFLTNSHLECVA